MPFFFSFRSCFSWLLGVSGRLTQSSLSADGCNPLRGSRVAPDNAAIAARRAGGRKQSVTAAQHTKGFGRRRRSTVVWRKPSSRGWSPAGETAGGSDSWAPWPSQQRWQIDLETRRLEEGPHSIMYWHPQTLQHKVAGWETGRIRKKTKPKCSVTFLALGHLASAPRSRSSKTFNKTPGTCCKSCRAAGPAHSSAGSQAPHPQREQKSVPFPLGKCRGTESR